MSFRKCKITLFASVLIVLSISFAHAVTEQIINPGGAVLDPLDPAGERTTGVIVYVGSNTQIQIASYDKPQVTHQDPSPPNHGTYKQFYSPVATPATGFLYNAVYLRVTPALGGAKRLYGGDSNGGPPAFVEVSQSVVTGTGAPADPYTVVTVVRPPAGADENITLTITDSYAVPYPFFTRQFSLSGLPVNGDRVSLYWHADTTLAGMDDGYGTSSGTGNNGKPTFIGNQRYGLRQGLQIVAGMPEWSFFHTGYYDTSRNLIVNGNDLTDVIDTSFSDVGFAVQWDIPANQTTFTTAVDQSYGNQHWASSALVPDTIAPGQISQLILIFQNFDEDTAAPNLSATFKLDDVIAYVSPVNMVNGCNGTASFNGDEFTLSNFSLPIAPGNGVASSCTVTIDVTSSTIGTHTPSGFINLSETLMVLNRSALSVFSGPIGVQPVPTLSEWLLAMLVLLLAGVAYREYRLRA